MRWSLNEARVICQRAAVGAGVPYGLAEDAAAAAAWLAAGGLPGMAVFRRCLDRFQSGQAAAVVMADDAGGLRLVSEVPGAAGSALFAGPGLSDAIAAGEPGEGEAPAVDEPLLVLGCAASAGGDAPAPFSLHWRGTGGARYQARRTDTGCSLWGAGGAAMDCPGPADVVVTRRAAPAGPALRCLISEHDLDDALRRGHERGVDVDDRDCEWLTALSRRMLVAESERSRAAGAGAGLRDND